MRIIPINIRYSGIQDHEFRNSKTPMRDGNKEALVTVEAVKEKILGIKAKVELSQTQGIITKSEQLGLLLLANPGTGMAGMLIVVAYVFIYSML